jgi:hypothetical protein
LQNGVFVRRDRTRSFHLGDPPSKINLVELSGNFPLAAMLENLGEAFAFIRKAVSTRI